MGYTMYCLSLKYRIVIMNGKCSSVWQCTKYVDKHHDAVNATEGASVA